ncbi:hypothetical protein NEISUBOT_03244 [Neisseria subflava NJ9703]|uniref:Uncharacterized protein n=1 Tax=Neisseria subflava NJ9703 TaxID=546268 RepID=A0A9W5N0D8_NEISU|nr:hypothetical protein NEISUBOT_03244 [Neisseria subflava NJ9703]
MPLGRWIQKALRERGRLKGLKICEIIGGVFSNFYLKFLDSENRTVKYLFFPYR